MQEPANMIPSGSSSPRGLDADVLDNAERLHALHELEVLESPPEPEFDALVKVAASACRTQISLLTLVDETRQWFKANHGMPEKAQGPRDEAFCAHTVVQGTFFEVEDAARDPRFADNPSVIGEPHLAFYAAWPVRLSDGHVVGALCVADRSPRRLDALQREVLANLAIAAGQALEGRRSARLAHRRTLDLQQSESRFRTLSEAAPLGVFQTDAGGACTYTNPRWQEIYGMSLADSLGDGWASALHPDDREGVFHAWSTSAADGYHEFEREFRIVRSDRSTRSVRARARAIVDASGTVTGFVGSVEDITRRRQLEAFLDRTGKLAGVGAWELDLHTQELTWSERTRHIHEVADDYIPTVESAISFYAPEARALITAAVQAGIDRGQPWDLELPLTTATGKEIWVRAMGEAEFDGERAVRLIGAFRDVTESRKRRLELAVEQSLRQEIQDQARATERLLAERSEMLDILAHEVRQPLNNASAALQGAASALVHSSSEGQVSPRLARARAVLASVLGSIDNTLAVAALLARPDAIERDDTDVDALLEVCIADFPGPERERIKIERRTHLRTVSMDMSLIRLALRNLLSNALKYSPADSPVRVVLADSDDPLGLLIDVVDSGHGVPNNVLARLFERKASGRPRTSGAQGGAVDKSARGLGLGLYIVRRVMELHGGSIELVRNTSEGATMRLTLAESVGD